MRIRRATWLAIGFATFGASLLSGCDESKRIRPGMREQEVIQILGKPTRILTDCRVMADYVWLHEDRDTCLPKAAKVLFFDRLVSLDVSVTISAGGDVVCVEGTYNKTLY